MDNLNRTAAWIKRNRLALGLSQEDLAKKLGVSKNTVNRWETARNGPTGGVCLDLVELFDSNSVAVLDRSVDLLEDAIVQLQQENLTIREQAKIIRILTRILGGGSDGTAV